MTFPDTELEAIYEDQVHTFVNYQTRVALRAMERKPDADLVMVYIEQPDGSATSFCSLILASRLTSRTPPQSGQVRTRPRAPGTMRISPRRTR